MKNNILIFFCLILSSSSYSFSLPTASFRELIQYSEYIVVAKVSNPENKIYNDTFYFKIENRDTFSVTRRMTPKYSETIELTVLSKLKGDLNDRQIIKVKNEGYISPDTYQLRIDKPTYPDNSIVIAFLGKADTGIVFYTIGATNNGTKLMHNEEEQSLFKQRILEYLDILKLKSERKKKEVTVEWLVKCIESKYTRIIALNEFPTHNYKYTYNITSYDTTSYSIPSHTEHFFKQLTKDQKKRIDSAFFTTDTIDYVDLYLVNLILKNNNTKLIKHLLKGLLLVVDYDHARAIMRKVIYIRPISRELQSIYIDFFDIEYDDVVNRKLLIDKFINVAKRELDKH